MLLTLDRISLQADQRLCYSSYGVRGRWPAHGTANIMKCKKCVRMYQNMLFSDKKLDPAVGEEHSPMTPPHSLTKPKSETPPMLTRRQRLQKLQLSAVHYDVSMNSDCESFPSSMPYTLSFL